MLFTMQRFKQAAGAGAICAVAYALSGVAFAADSEVPSQWNVAPLTAGVYREAFDVS